MNRSKLEVRFRGRRVGLLAEANHKKYAFAYDEKWLKDGFPISPFSLKPAFAQERDRPGSIV